MGTVSNVKVEPVKVTWGGTDLGFTEGDVEVAVEEQKVDVTGHQEGTNVLTHIRTGKSATIALTLKETSVAQVNAMLAAGGAAATAAAEVNTVTCLADSSGSLNNKFFTLYSAADATKYHVWFDVSSGGTDPAPAGSTGIEVDIITDDTASAVATATAAAIGALGDFGSTSLGAIVTTTSAANGGSTDVSDGSAATGFAFATTTQGTLAVTGWGKSSDFTQTLAESDGLVLHPVVLGDSDLSRDWFFPKAYPQVESISHSGENPMSVSVTFTAYPDTSRPAETRLFAYGDSK